MLEDPSTIMQTTYRAPFDSSRERIPAHLTLIARKHKQDAILMRKTIDEGSVA